MTVKEKREYLERYKYLEFSIKKLQNELSGRELDAGFAPPPDNNVRVQGGKMSDPIPDSMDGILKTEGQILKLIEEKKKTLTEIIECINSVPDERYRTFLESRYICGMRTEDIGAELGYERSRSYDILYSAIASINIG